MCQIPNCLFYNQLSTYTIIHYCPQIAHTCPLSNKTRTNPATVSTFHTVRLSVVVIAPSQFEFPATSYNL